MWLVLGLEFRFSCRCPPHTRVNIPLFLHLTASRLRPLWNLFSSTCASVLTLLPSSQAQSEQGLRWQDWSFGDGQWFENKRNVCFWNSCLESKEKQLRYPQDFCYGQRGSTKQLTTWIISFWFSLSYICYFVSQIKSLPLPFISGGFCHQWLFCIIHRL